MSSYSGCCWIALVQGGGGWEVRVKGNLASRADNGRINSSPITAEFPVFRLQHGATHTISIPGKVVYLHTSMESHVDLKLWFCT